jgi:hypothetical protein
MRANAPFPVGRISAALAFLALALLPATLFAQTHAKPEKKKHVATQHAVKHPDAHPEAQSKKRDAEAKKRLAKDRGQEKKNKKQVKKADQAAKARKAHPVAQRTRPNRSSKPREVAKTDRTAKIDPATAGRVHAWVNSQNAQKQPAPDTHTAASADPNKATLPANPPAAADSTNGNATGTSNPPPDTPQAESISQPASVVSLVRGSSRDRPQLPPVEDLAAEPVILPTLYNKRGRLVVPPPLKGSHEILIRQNQVADDEGLDRIQNDEDLDRLRAAGLLIAIPSNVMLHVDERLPANRRYCRPWTALFLDTLARQHYARFQSTLQLTSAVRTVAFQQQLIHRNGNAAPAEGDTASPHLTGQAVDIGKKGLTMAEIAWLRGYLLPLVQQGKVDVEEEFQQSCFHISVYKSYLPRAGAGRRSISGTHGSGIDALATGLR